MAATRWKRVGKKSGPANCLDGRWEIRRTGRYWLVYDHEQHQPRLGIYATMRDARAAAERRAARGGSEAWS